MFFKNLQVYRLPANWPVTSEMLEGFLAHQAFSACTSLEMLSQGWISPRGNGMLVHTVNRQMLIELGTEKKLLPATVINQVTKARAAEIEEQQGFAPGRKQMRELKEDVTDELLPRAFSIRSSTWAWIDPVNGWLVIDAGSPAKAEEVLKLLIRAVPTFPLETLRTKLSPMTAMTSSLLNDEALVGFTVDQDTELRSSGEGKATVRYVHHALEADDVRRHIEAGKQCTRLAMTWNDKISFVLTEGLAIKRVAPLDVLKEDATASTKNEEERFDSDMMLMTGELNLLLTELVASLGGEPEQTDLVKELASTKGSIADATVLSATEFKDLYVEAVKVVRSENNASISLVQRHLRTGYNMAARLLETMEGHGVVSSQQRDGKRVVLPAPDATAP